MRPTRDRIDLTRWRVLVALALCMAGLTPATAQPRQAEVCAATAADDPAEGGPVDIARYAGGVTCDGDSVTFTFTTHDEWDPAALSELYVRIDTDGDVTNGCSEGDYLLYGVNAPDDGTEEVVGGVFAIPSCDDVTPVGSAAITVLDRRTVTAQVDLDLLGDPGRIGHYGQLSAAGETNATADYAPDTGRVVLELGPLPDPVSAPLCLADDGGDVLRVAGGQEAPATNPAVDVTEVCAWYGDWMQLDLTVPGIDLDRLVAGGPAALIDLDLDGTAERTLRALWDGAGFAVSVREGDTVVCTGRAEVQGATLRVGALAPSCVDDVAVFGLQVGMGVADGPDAAYLDRLGDGGFVEVRRLGPVDPADTGTSPGAQTVPDPAAQPPSGSLDRLFGPARIETSVAVSQRAWPDGAAAVVLARQDVEADALAGAPLAVAAQGPLVLTASDGLTPTVARELRRVLPPGGRVYVLGGVAAIADQVVAEVQQLGYGVVRLAGPSRVETGLAIAEETAALLGMVAHVVVVDAFEFQWALMGGAAAGANDGVVITTAASGLTPAAQAFVDAHPSAQLTAVGPAASTAVPEARSLDGTDPYGTSVMVAQAFFPGAQRAVVASGEAFPDGLAGGALAGSLGVPMLLSPQAALANPVTNYLSGGGWTDLTMLGGEVALGSQVEAALQGFVR